MRTFARAQIALLTASLLFACLAPAAEAAKPRRAGPSTATQRRRSQALIAGGLASLKRKEFRGAIAAFRAATQADPGSAEAFFQLGTALSRRASSGAADAKDTERALDAYQTALALDPDHKSVSAPFLLYHGLAQCYEALGRYDDAADSLRKESKAASRNPMPPLYSAELRLKMREPKKSAEGLHESVQRARKLRSYPSLAKLVRTDPRFANLLQVPQNQMILETYDRVEAGKLAEAEARSHVEERLSMRDALAPMSAAKAMAPIVAAAPPDPKIQARLDRAEGDFKWRKYRQAAAEYIEALRLDEKRGTMQATDRAHIYLNIGICYRMLGLMGDAAEALRFAAQEKPEDSEPYYQLALALSSWGKVSAAMEALETALQKAAPGAQLRLTLLLARTDSELEALRDVPAYHKLLAQYAPKPRRNARR